MTKYKVLLAALMACSCLAACSEAQQISEQPKSDLFQTRWHSGVQENEPELQVQPLNSNTIALRQSLKTSFEAPFMYLLLGNERALLIDTGASGIDLRKVVDQQISTWLDRHGKTSLALTVMHTHGHGDHVAGDSAFADRPNTQIVGHSPEEVSAFFGIENWPIDQVSYDLGGRSVEILPTPGHHPAHVMVYDRASKLLYSGDSLYPGRLYFQCGKLDEYQASLQRVATFANNNSIEAVLGAHIELALEPGKQYSGQEKARFDERLLELPGSAIIDLLEGLRSIKSRPVITPFPDFILFPHPTDPRGKTPPNWCLTE
jgi:hydroxyacylglutathione hydrolase